MEGPVAQDVGDSKPAVRTPRTDRVPPSFRGHLESPPARAALVGPPVSPRLELAAPWTSVLFLMIYADYFELYLPRKLPSMLEGRMGPLGPVTEGVIVGVTILMSVPSTLMVIQGARWFYVLFGLFEIALLVSAILIAWRWPRAA